ncbi:MAG: LamG-like jellyroll fold domain-containing protein [Geobacteraceae bacterium]|nr:LamG-like jellyroll fold domain-containing protein [Geobacteraceae bacterium]
MKRLLSVALGLSLLVLVMPFDICVAGISHNTSNNVSCPDCHNSSLPSNSSTFNSNCLSCHGTNGPASHRLADTDQAKTSHRWTGNIANPGAGAQSPAVGAMAQLVTDYTGNQLACVNCHNPHDNNNLETIKYSRIANEKDQLCLDCHRSRDVKSHRVEPGSYPGSHPVNVRYPEAVVASPGDYNNPPLNANQNNPGSDLGARLTATGGLLLCSTCHGVHTAYSQSANPPVPDSNGNLGDGNLLRTNPRGAAVASGQPDSINICTNCHAGKMNHNARGQDIQCLDCHAAHVDYDPNDPAGANGVNIKLIRRNVTKAGQPSRIFFRNPTYGDNYKNPDGTGVCEGCHAAPTTEIHASVQPADCKSCHTHGNSKGAFSASCDTCHGFPPSATSQPAVPGHPANVNCSLCHNTTDPSLHMNGTLDVATTCDGCHGNPPNYPNGSPKTNSHSSPSHRVACNKCHAGTTSDGTTITNTALHMNGAYNLQAGTGVSFSYTYATSGGTCSNISCHGALSANWGGTVTCLVCHSIAQGPRAAITSQFGANSHHIQGIVTDDKCYQCHWEANSNGSINPAYHSGSAASGAPVDLVVYGAGARPATYNTLNAATAVQYTANGSRSEIQKINSHCLGCHSDQNNTTQPFGDGKTPRQYAWDGTSVAARYAQSGKTTWGKYATVANAAKKNIDKAYSAHGNAAANKRGWSAATGVDGVIPDTAGTATVLCYDCHNSHGSTVTGVTTRYASATPNGGILKTTVAGRGGYGVGYQPAAAGDVANKDRRNPGASLCLDCHQNQTAATTPWGYGSTFGATQSILGYWDTPFMSSGLSGEEQRFPFKSINPTKGGHFGASLAMSSNPMASIDGLCTPCHDPHGVSPTLGANQQYAVPLLKGTWVTSPYKEDAPPSRNEWQTNYTGGGVQYHIDQNTFGSGIWGAVTGMTQSVDQSSGLCLGCHPKDTLTAAAGPANPNPWKSKNRIHESVKGWKTSNGKVEHNYSCSKCHSAHTGATLPRLMVTNCLDSKHKGMMGYNMSPVVSGSGSGDGGSGSGRIPGSFAGGGYDGGPGDYSVTCHDSATANGGSDGTNQGWNNITPWIDSTPAITSGPSVSTGGLRVLLHLDEATWNGTPNQVVDSSGANNHGTSYNGANTVAGGISGRAGSFNNSYVAINYVSGLPPMDNFTMEAWVKPTTTHQIDPESNGGVNGVYYQNYVFKPDNRGDYDSGAGISVGTNGISVYEHGNNYMPPLAVYSGAISSAQWTHVAVVYRDRRPSIYVNGTLVRTGLQSPRQHVYAPQWIGKGDYGYFVGQVDDVAIYDKSLSASEVQMHSQQNYSVYCGSNGAVLSWTTNINATSYVDYGLTTGYGSTEGNDVLVTSHSLTLPNLTNGTTYHYRVRSQNAFGVETGSGDKTFTMGTCVVPTQPSAPTAISAVPGSTQATVSWTAGTGSDSSLIRYGTVSGNYTTTIDPATSPRVISGLVNGTTVYYQVGAKNAAGTTWSVQYSVTPVGLPSAPTAISSTAGNTQATITWTAGTGSTSSLIRYGTVSGSYTTTIDPATSPRVISGLVNGTTVYYQVGAKNISGTSWSSEYSFTPVAVTVVTVNLAIAHHVGMTESGGVFVDYSDPNTGDAIIWAGPFDGWDVDRSFISFDTAALGAGATITSARLYLDYQNGDYMEDDIDINVHGSTWDLNAPDYNNIGSYLSSSRVYVGQAFGLTSFVIDPNYINRVGVTKFAILAANEDYYTYYNADPGYSRLGSYLEIKYTIPGQ